MRKHWKKLALILGCSMLLGGQVPVRVYAEEEAHSAEQTVKLLEATDLKWNNNGQGVFNNPNEKSFFEIRVYDEKGNENMFKMYDHAWGKGEVYADLYHYFSESGKYKYQVRCVHNGMESSGWSGMSEEFSYTKPDKILPRIGFWVSESGYVKCDLSNLSAYKLGEDYGINYYLNEYDGSGQLIRTLQQGTNSPEFDFSSEIKPDHTYTVQVVVMSRKLEFVDSSISPEIRLGGSYDGGYSSERHDSPSGDGCSHNYEWETVTEATDTQDGREAYRCTRCGHVKAHMEVANSAYAQFNKNAIASIDRAPLNGTVTLRTNMWVSFYDDVIETLKGRPDVTVVVKYFYEGTHYAMTIPAGADLSALAESEGYYGFRYLDTFFPGKVE